MESLKDRFKQFIKDRNIHIDEKSIDKMFNDYDRENIKMVR